MALYVNDNVSEYTTAVVYLKNTSQLKITVPGKVVSVETDTYAVKIQTEEQLAVFNTDDVVAVTFLK